MNIKSFVDKYKGEGYSQDNAEARACQDIVLKAISIGPLNRNVTIKGGVVMRSITGNIRRATQDMDIDFLRYSLADMFIDEFILKLNCLEGIKLKRMGDIEELSQQDYHGKRIHVLISDDRGYVLKSKIDIGVHKYLEIEQELYCFDIAFDDEGASLLINSPEQMFTEKLRSLLKFGPFSTRYKDVFDMYYYKDSLRKERLEQCFKIFIYDDPGMRENCIEDIVRRVSNVFSSKAYMAKLKTTDKNWLNQNIKKVTDGLLDFLQVLQKADKGL